ncbi:MAG: hypothetical protein BIFFINMI_03967 [Phycisphaerae bacterium]|nr:hypothetical protein [Phycisphaerae bacterium]
MRMLLQVEMDTEKGNAAARDGTLGSKVKAILDQIKPEAAYFVAHNGKRCGLIFVDMTDPSQLPALAEPFFLAFNASLSVQPAMVAADLAKAEPAIAKAVKAFG